MITSAVLTILKDLLDAVLSPLLSQSDVVLDPHLTSAVSNVQGFINTLDPIFPITTLLACIAIVLAVELAIFAYKAIMWLIKKIPMIS